MKIIVLGFMVWSISTHASCGKISTLDFWNRVKNNHPKLLQENAIKDANVAASEALGQRLNPELEISADTGEANNQKVQSLEVEVLIPVELGGKREAREQVAGSDEKLAMLGFEYEQAEILIDTYTQAHRLRQIYNLEKLQRKAIKTMRRYQANLSKRSSLSPEQEVELGAIDLALSDMELKLASSVSHAQEIARHLGFYAGLNCAIDVSTIPKQATLSPISREAEVKGVELALAKLRVDRAHSQMALERANESQNISVGPIIRYEKEKSDNSYAVGLKINFELPVFERNLGGRNRAAKEVIARELEFENVRKESQFDLETWYNRYQRSVDSLQNASRNQLLQKRREKVEKFFSRGVISAALVIETYRQLIEFTQSRDEFELSALQARAKILNLTGKIDQLSL